MHGDLMLNVAIMIMRGERLYAYGNDGFTFSVAEMNAFFHSLGIPAQRYFWQRDKSGYFSLYANPDVEWLLAENTYEYNKRVFDGKVFYEITVEKTGVYSADLFRDYVTPFFYSDLKDINVSEHGTAFHITGHTELV